MCFATVYVDHGDQMEEVMRDVAWIEPEGHDLLLIAFMGEKKLLQARIKNIDLLNSSVVLTMSDKRDLAREKRKKSS